MNKYNVTRGEESREIVAANDREALRRFGAQSGDGAKANVVEANLADPPKHRYRVSWADEVREVEAVHEDDAWSQFIGGNENHPAYKQPKAFPRVIECLDEECNTEADSQSDEESPVAGESVADAKDKISRMRSVEKLQAIAANDPHVSLQAAAKARLEEIKGE